MDEPAGYGFRQLQMPPDLQGQTWMRVSIACASSGLVCRRASCARAGRFVRAGERGLTTLRWSTIRVCATLVLGTRTCAAAFRGAGDGATAGGAELPESA